MSTGRPTVAGSDKFAPSQQRQHSCALLAAVVVLLLAALPCSVARAQSDSYAFSGSLMFGPFFPPGQWHPVQFTLRNDTKSDRSGFAVIRLDKSDQPARYMVPVLVPAHSRVMVTGLACFKEIEPTETQRRAGTVPPVGTALWESGGGILAGQQHEIIASSVATLSRERQDLSPNNPVLALGIGVSETPMLDSQDVMGLREMLSSATGRAAGAGTAGLPDTPRHRPGFGSFRIIVLDMDRMDDLDRAQQIALLDQVRTGGVLIVASPTPQSVSGNWINPYLPVEIVGRREATSLTGTAAGRIQAKLKLREPVPMAESILRDGARAILADDSYTLVADRPLGLGRIVFMGVPVNTLLASDASAVEIWRMILQPTISDWDPGALIGRMDGGSVPARPAGTAGNSSNSSPAAGDSADVLAQLIGRPVPALGLAGGIAIGYLAAVLLLQLVIRGPARPKAFVAALAVGVVLAVGLVVMSLSQRGKQDLLAARLSVADIGAGGGGFQRDVLAYVGKDQRDFGLNVRSNDATLRPLLSRSGAAPDVHLDPMEVPAAEVFSQRIQRIWQAEGQVATDRSLAVECQFGPSGAVVTATNRLKQSVTGPLLVWRGQRVRLGTIPAGDAAVSVPVREANAWDDFTNPGLANYDTDRLRGQFLKAVVESAAEPPRAMDVPFIAGWVDGNSFPSLVQPSSPPVPRAQVMVRAGVTVTPSPVGTTVLIPAGFVQMDYDRGFLPIVNDRGGFTESSQTGELLLGFAPPWQAGRIDLSQLHLVASLASRDHLITIRRGQVKDGKPSFNPDGPALTKWDREVGERETGIVDLNASDLDKEGRVWLALVIEDRGDGPLHLWRLDRIAVELRGSVSGPPAGPRPVPVVQQTTQPPKVTPPPKTPPKTTPKTPPKTPAPKTPQPKAK